MYSILKTKILHGCVFSAGVIVVTVLFMSGVCCGAYETASENDVSSIDMRFETATVVEEREWFWEDYLWFVKEDGLRHKCDLQGGGTHAQVILLGSDNALQFQVSAAGPDKDRSEMKIIQDLDLDETYYTSFVMAPAANQPIPQNGLVFWQTWQCGDQNPPINLGMDDMGNYHLKVNNDDSESNYLFRDVLPLNFTTYNIEYRLATNTTGRVRLWVDDEKKLDYEGVTNYATECGSDFGTLSKCGIYKSYDGQPYVSYYDNVLWGKSKVWDSGDEYEVIPDGGLIGQWKFDEPMAVQDDSPVQQRMAQETSGGCSYPGNRLGGVTMTDGYSGGAAHFDGVDDYIAVTENSIWDAGGQLTVCCRFRTTVNQTGKGLVVHDSSNYKYLLYLTSESASVSFYTRTASGTTSCGNNFGTGYFADGQWHTLVGVYDRYAADGLRLKCYVDGALAGSAAGYNEPILDGDEGIFIGAYGTHYFEGDIDDVEIYNYPLSEKEANAYMNRNCIAHWRFDDVSTSIHTNDSSGMNNPMLLLNGASRTTDGYSGSALLLDGVDDCIQTFDDRVVYQPDAITLSCWFKADATPAANRGIFLTADLRFMLWLDSASSKIRFSVRPSGGSIAASSPTGNYAGAWHHIVGVYDRYASDGQRIKLYIDGTLAGTHAGVDETLTVLDKGVLMGRYNSGYVKGIIDDAAIYRVALTAAQVAEMYNSPLCYYDFDEGYSKVAGDSSYMHAPQGLLMNGAGWTTGYSGSAVYLNGVDDYVEFPDDQLWDVKDKLTVSCRFKTSVNQTSKGLVMHDATYRYLLYLTSSSGLLRFHVRTASGTAYAATPAYAAGHYADDQWHTVVGVFDRYAADGQRIKIYVDGGLAGSAAGYNEDILEGDEGLYIGKYSTNYFDGAIDDVRIYNRALSRAEIPMSFNMDDLSVFVASWLSVSGQAGYNPNCNLNNDSIINLEDFAILAQYWLNTEPAGN